MAADEVNALLAPVGRRASGLSPPSARIAVLHTALGRIGGAERQLVRFVEGARANGAHLDVYYSGPSFAQLDALGNRFPALPPGAGPTATYRAYLGLLRELRTYDRIIIYHHVEPILLALVALLQGDRCIAYLGEPLRPLWEEEVSGDRTLVSYPEMEKTARQLYGPFIARLVHHPIAMGGIVRALRWLDRGSHGRLPLLLANSQWMARILQRVYRLRTLPEVVYQGVPPASVRRDRSPGEGVVLSVGAFIPLKDHATLLRAWQAVESRLRRRCPQLVLVGEGPTLAASRALAQSLGLDRVRFVPHASADELSAWYGRACLLVHSAVGEPFGMTPVEAAAHQVPALVSDGGGAIEFVIDGASGRTFPARDVDRLADTLVALLNDPEELARLGRRALVRQRSGFTIGDTVTGLLFHASLGATPSAADGDAATAFSAPAPPAFP